MRRNSCLVCVPNASLHLAILVMMLSAEAFVSHTLKSLPDRTSCFIGSVYYAPRKTTSIICLIIRHLMVWTQFWQPTRAESSFGILRRAISKTRPA